MALTFTARGTGSNTTSSTSCALTLTTGVTFTQGHWIVITVGYDNSGSSGADPYSSIATSITDTWTSRINQLNDPAAANAGNVLRIFTAGPLAANRTVANGGTLGTITFGTASLVEVWTIWEVEGTTGPVSYVTGGNTSGASGTSPTQTTASIAQSHGLIAAINSQYGTAQTYTDDTDTTNGSWSSSQKLGAGTTGAGQSILAQSKVVNAAGTQIFNSTLGTAASWTEGYVVFKESPSGFAQANAQIKVFDVEVFAQAQTSIKTTSIGYAQSNATIIVKGNSFAQAQTKVILSDQKGYSQAQAQIKTTYRSHAQANVWIKQTYPLSISDGTLVVYADSNDGSILSEDVAYEGYATASAGTGLLTLLNATNATQVGQYSPDDFWLFERFEAFDTSSIGAGSSISAAVLNHTISTATASPVAHTNEVRIRDWGDTLTTSDWVAGSALSGLTLVAHLNVTGGISTNTSRDWTDDALPANINKTGSTRVLMATDHMASVTEPTGNEYLRLYTVDAAGTTYDPKLTITYSDIEGSTFAQANTQIKAIYKYKEVAQANAWIRDTNQVFAQVQVQIQQTYKVVAQANTQIRATYKVVAQAQTQIKNTYRSYAQAQTAIQGKVFAQAQAQIKTTYKVVAQAQGTVRATYRVYAQAQSTVRQTYIVVAQAQTKISTTRVYAQGQAQIRRTYQVVAQANVWIRDTNQIIAQAQTQIKTVYRGYAQAKVQIKQTYPRTALYAQTIISDFPIGYWRLGESSGNPQDSSGNNNHVTTVAGTPTYGVAGAIAGDGNTAIAFNGTTDYFSVTDHSSLDMADVFTMEAWINRGAIDGSRGIISKGSNAGYLRVLNNGNLTLNKTNVGIIVQSTSTIPTGWHHVVGTKNGADVHLYIDGIDVTGTVTDLTCAESASPLYIGVAEGSIEFNNGSIDEAAVYNYALTPAQVAVHYQVGQIAVIGPTFAQAQTKVILSDQKGYSQAQANIKATYKVVSQAQALIKQTYPLVPSITPVFSCGAEATTEPNSGTHWSSSSGTYSRDTTHVRSGTYAWKFSPGGVYLGVNLPAPTQHLVGRLWVWLDAAPNGDSRLFDFSDGQWRSCEVAPDGYAYFGQKDAEGTPGGVASTLPFPIAQWVAIDFWSDSSANTHYHYWRINGIAQTTHSENMGTSNNFGGFDLIGDTCNQNTWIDDIVLSKTASDYPIIDGYVNTNDEWFGIIGPTFAQSQVSIKATSKVFAQANAYIRLVGLTVYAQAQSRINQTYYGLAQAQTDIRATYTVVSQAQAQTNIKTTYRSYAQSNAWVKVTGNVTFAQANSDIKTSYTQVAQSQTTIKATYQVVAQAQAQIKQTYPLSEGGSYSSTVLSDTPTAYWRLGETTGTNAHDEIGSNDGTYMGTPILGTAGALTGDSDTAFGAYGSYIAVPASAGIPSTNFSVEMWAKSGDFAGTDGICYVWLGEGAVHNGRLYVQADGKVVVRATTNELTSGEYYLQPDIWYHIVFTYGLVAGSGRLYINGVDRTVTGAGDTFGAADQTWYWGSYASPPAYTFPADSALDELAIYSHVLTPAQVLNHYNVGKKSTINPTSAQAQGTIKQTYQSYAQVNAYIRGRVLGFAQAQTDTRQTYQVYSQASVWVKNTGNFTYAQAQATTKQSYVVAAQSNAQIKQTYQSYAQAQSRIKQTYLVYAQGQTQIKATSFAVANAQARVLQTYPQFAQAQTSVRTMYVQFAQAQAGIKATSQVYAQAQAAIKATYLVYASAQTTIKQTYLVYAQARTAVKSTYLAYAQAQGHIKHTANVYFAQSQVQIKAQYTVSAQAQAKIYLIVPVVAQAQAFILSGKSAYAQAQTVIRTTYRVYAQTQVWIGGQSIVFAQAQAKLNAFAVTQVAQANAWIKRTYVVHAQAGTDIRAQYQSYAQSNATIRQTYIVVAQANARVKQAYQGFAQAQSIIKTINPVYAQSAAQIKASYLVVAQAQTVVRTLNYVVAQAQTIIRQSYTAQAQAQAALRQSYVAVAQAQAKIKAYNVQTFAQAQSSIKFDGNAAFAQAQTKIKAFAVQSYGQALADIKQTYRSYAQAIADIKTTYLGYAQANAKIVTTYAVFAQAQVTIRASYQAYAQTQARILKAYQAYAQTTVQIKRTNEAFAQAQTTVILSGQVGFAQAQTQIKSTYQYYSQAQTSIKTSYQVYASAQALITTYSSNYGQSQAWIRSTYSVHAQATALIIGTASVFAQANAYIKLEGLTVFAQAQAVIIKSTAHAQALALIYQPVYLYDLELSDTQVLHLEVSDIGEDTITDSNLTNLEITLSDIQGLHLVLTDILKVNIEASDRGDTNDQAK